MLNEFKQYDVSSKANNKSNMDRTSLAAVQSMSYLTLQDPLNCSMPGFPVLHYLQEFA